MYQKIPLDAYRNRLLRVISVIIEIINYPFKLEKMRFKCPFFHGPPLPLAVASLEKKKTQATPMYYRISGLFSQVSNFVDEFKKQQNYY